MSYKVLATKWRPNNFKDIVGQEHIVRTIKNSLCKSMLHNVYLFTGTRGVGKTTIARILAKSFNCENIVDGEPCNNCNSCLQINKGNFVDLFELDAASNTGVDNIKEILDNCLYLPTIGKYKVYIIDEVHMLSKSAFNAMLKTLEEPPSHTKFILATTEFNKIPVTILSRCLQFVLYNLTIEQISSRLKHILNHEQVPFEVSSLELIARFATGSMRDALSLLDQAIALGNGEVSKKNIRQMLGIVDRNYLFNLLLDIHYLRKDKIFQSLKEISGKTVSFATVLEEISVILQEIALFQINNNAININNPDYATIQELSNILQSEEIQIYYQCSLQGKRDLKLNPDEYSGFMMTILRMIAFVPLYFEDDSNQTNIIDKKKSKAIDSICTQFNTNLIADQENFTEEVSICKNNNSHEDECSIICHKSHDNILPDLNKNNWQEVISNMTNYLGPINIYVKNSKLVSIDDDSIHLAINPDSEKYTKNYLEKLKEIFKKYYCVDIKIVPWEKNYVVTYGVCNKNLNMEKQTALVALNNDKIIKKLKEDLNLDWDLDSVKLININS